MNTNIVFVVVATVAHVTDSGSEWLHPSALFMLLNSFRT